jgi:hypothetical protein
LISIINIKTLASVTLYTLRLMKFKFIKSVILYRIDDFNFEYSNNYQQARNVSPTPLIDFKFDTNQGADTFQNSSIINNLPNRSFLNAPSSIDFNFNNLMKNNPIAPNNNISFDFSGSQKENQRSNPSAYSFDFNTSTNNGNNPNKIEFDFTNSNKYINALGGSPVDNNIFFRENLSENPLLRESAKNILENAFISTDKSSKSTIKETIDSLKTSNQDYDYGKARIEAYAPTNITNPSEANYKTALLDHHLMKELLSGVVFKGSNDFTKDLGEKYANDLNILNTNEIGARERYIAVTKALKEKLGSTEDDPLSLITKDIITKMGKVTVQERDKNGEVVKVEGKTKDLTITVENFQRYLDDPALQKAIQTEIDKRFHYQNNNYGTVIDNYRAKHPEIAPEKVKSEKGEASLLPATKDKLTTLNNQIQQLRKTGNSDPQLGDILIGSASDKTITPDDRKEKRKGWGDYDEFKWGESTYGTIFSTENKASIEKLYSENIKKGESVKHLDQFTALMVKLIEKGTNGTITNQEVDLLKKITIDSDWKPKGDSSKEIAATIINVIKDGSEFWK